MESFVTAQDRRFTLPRNERPEHILDALGGLDRALSGHTEWLKKWHMLLLHSLENSAGQADVDEVLACRFLDRFDATPHAVLQESPILIELREAGTLMQEKARHLLELVKNAEVIPADQYDSFMNTVLEFNSLARHLQNETWNLLTNIDPLTGIGNRKVMTRELEREHDRFLRSQRPCTVLIADIDHFKRVNDTYGHPVGDRVIVEVADCFVKQLRPYDSVHRYGGEEFLFCLPDTDVTMAATVAERLRRKIEDLIVTLADGETVAVTVSIGLAQMDAQKSIAETISKTDAALYRAKAAGRNRIETA